MSERADSRTAGSGATRMGASAGSVGPLFARIVSTLGASVSFDRAELALIESPEAIRVFEMDVAGTGEATESLEPKQRYPDAFWSVTPASPLLVRDDKTAGSRLVLSVRSERRPLGLLVLSSGSADAFEAAKTAALAPIVDLMAITLERERLWSLEERRQQRRAKLAALLPKIAEALDVRQVFLSLSGVIQEIVPHDILAFALLSPDRGGVKVQAATHAGLLDLPEYRFSTEEEALDTNWRFLLAQDLSLVREG
ncbi:MAG: hypothetical protein K1Y01_20665, partial [Vicinamibacteria bacterium]|nr:hypothetical protein [Vicinamibacteria bacterium]